MKNNLTILFLSILLTTTVFSVYSQNYKQDSFYNLNIQIDSLINKYKIPGFSLVILNKDSILYNKNDGFTDIEKKIKVTDNSKFRVGSITKSFLALGFAKLQEDGLIDLNTTLESLAPEITLENKWKKEHPIKLIHLLEHTAGLEDIHLNDLSLDNISTLPLKVILLNNQKKLLKTKWKPGSRYAYSSIGYTIAGYILEKVTNKKYEVYLKEAFLEPLEMSNSSFYNTDNDVATGYQENLALPKVYMYSRPAGSLVSSTNDMSNFLQFLLNNCKHSESKILSASTIKSIGIPTSSMASKHGLKIGYGLGMRSNYRNGIKWLGHNGGGPGCLANYLYAPELGIGFAFMMNTFIPNAEIEIINIIINTIATDINYNGNSNKISENNLDKYLGYYEPNNPRVKMLYWLSILFDGITIEKNNEKLFIKSFLGNKTDLIEDSKGMFKKTGEPSASSIFFNNSNNKEVFQNVNKYYIKKPSWLPWFYRTIFAIITLSFLSVLLITYGKISLYIYQKFLLRKKPSSNIKLYLSHFLAIIFLILGIIIVSNQTQVDLTQRNLRNILFSFSTYLFASLTLVGLYITISNFNKILKPITKYYILIVSLSSFGLIFFLEYWGILGLKLWDF